MGLNNQSDEDEEYTYLASLSSDTVVIYITHGVDDPSTVRQYDKRDAGSSDGLYERPSYPRMDNYPPLCKYLCSPGCTGCLVCRDTGQRYCSAHGCLHRQLHRFVDHQPSLGFRGREYLQLCNSHQSLPPLCLGRNLLRKPDGHQCRGIRLTATIQLYHRLCSPGLPRLRISPPHLWLEPGPERIDSRTPQPIPRLHGDGRIRTPRSAGRSLLQPGIRRSPFLPAPMTST